MFRRAQTQIRVVNSKQNEQPTGKVVIRAAGMSPEREIEQLKQSRGAYVNVQNEEGKRSSQLNNKNCDTTDCIDGIVNTPILKKKYNKNRIDELQENINIKKYNNYHPENLRTTGNTPKLTRKKLLVSNFDLITPNKNNNILNTIQNNNNNNQLFCERKIKRSESYRMANSPIMFIKKLSINNLDKSSSKIIRTASEELREDLLKETINYPDSVASPGINDSNFDNNCDSNNLSNDSVKSLQLTSPSSPRPRALDIEPARVLKYSTNDTEIW